MATNGASSPAPAMKKPAAGAAGAAPAYHRLKQAGFGEEEIAVSRAKLAELVKRVDPKAVLSFEVEEVLLELSAKFVESAAKFGCKLAQHRGSRNLELADLRRYVESTLGVHVTGFGTQPEGNLPASFYADAHLRGNPGHVPEEHAARLRLKRKAREAHVVLRDDFSIAVESGKKRIKVEGNP